MKPLAICMSLFLLLSIGCSRDGSPQPRETTLVVLSDQGGVDQKEERDMLMKQFLEKGGKVEKLAPGNAKVYGSLSRGGKPPYTDAQLKAQWKAKNGSSNS